MKNRNPYLVLFLAMTIFICSSCEKETTDLKSPPSYQAIDQLPEFVPINAIEVLKSLNMPINEGSSIDVKMGTYYVDPCNLKNSTLCDDEIGCKMNSFSIILSKQDPNSEIINLKIESSNSRAISYDSAIIGNDNKFTLFARSRIYNSMSPGEYIIAISGEFIDRGIKDVHIGYYMLNNSGNSLSEIMGNSECRVLYDPDAISDKVLIRTIN